MIPVRIQGRVGATLRCWAVPTGTSLAAFFHGSGDKHVGLLDQVRRREVTLMMSSYQICICRQPGEKYEGIPSRLHDPETEELKGVMSETLIS